MPLAEFIAWMPKVELHVHLEGSIRPETLLRLAKRNDVALPASTVEELRDWYRFRDFNHFVEIYVAASSCIKSPDDIELIACEFAEGQKAQNILHSEVTYTAETIERICGIPWQDQWTALRNARDYARRIGVTMDYVVDIVREVRPEVGLVIADWAIGAMQDGVCALGLSGVEGKTPVDNHEEAFRRAKKAGLKITTHAGETSGPQSIWDCLEVLHADRIGHGIRCLEDDALVDELRDRQIPLEVCPTSNVCLGNAASIGSHPIEAMLTRGLDVTVNSDDPPMFNTTLTQEWQRCAEAFAWDERRVRTLTKRAIEASFADAQRKRELLAAIVEPDADL